MGYCDGLITIADCDFTVTKQSIISSVHFLVLYFVTRDKNGFNLIETRTAKNCTLVRGLSFKKLLQEILARHRGPLKDHENF